MNILLRKSKCTKSKLKMLEFIASLMKTNMDRIGLFKEVIEVIERALSNKTNRYFLCNFPSYYS